MSETSDQATPKEEKKFISASAAKAAEIFFNALTALRQEIYGECKTEQEKAEKETLVRGIFENTLKVCQNALGIEDKILVIKIVPKQFNITVKGSLAPNGGVQFHTHCDTDLADETIAILLQQLLDRRSALIADDHITLKNQEKAKKLIQESLDIKSKDTTI